MMPQGDHGNYCLFSMIFLLLLLGAGYLYSIGVFSISQS